MNIGLLNIMHNKVWDFRTDLAQTYADALKNAIELHLPNDIEKQHGYFLSKKGYQKDGQTHAANFEDKLYVGNIHRIERHLYWNDEELQDDDEIINVVVVDGPVTRDGDGCSYGTKDFRDQVMYANTIPQVVGHLFIINTPGGQASCRNDYEMMINDCREKGKPTVAFVDGMCCSSGVNLACRCDRVIVMNPRDEYGCIGTMAAFWAVAHDTVSEDGYRYVELVGKDCPEKNDWYREAAKGEYEKLQAELDKDTDDFHNEVRQNRPLVTDNMLTGKVFEAQEVIPALVDEIGDMNRAIECVFELANETLTAARLVTSEPKNEPGEKPDTQEPEEMAKLSEQQKAAIAVNKGGTTIVDDGHVRKVKDGMFGGSYEEEVAQPQNQDNMTEEEKKAAEAEAAKAAEKNDEAAQAEGQEAEGQAAGEGAGEGAQEGAGEGSQEGAGEGAQEGAQEGASEGTGEGEGEGSGEGEGAGEGEGTGEGTGEGEGSGEGSGDQNSEKSIEEAQAEIDKIQETLHNAEQMIADKDKEIAELKESLDGQKNTAEQLQADIDQARKDIETANGTIAERDATITGLKEDVDKLTKQVSDLKDELKEMAGKPAPMANADSGIPADNGTGDAPEATGTVRSTVNANMSPEEIRDALRKRDAEIKARGKRR